MKLSKKLLSLLLAIAVLCTVIGMLPVTALADEPVLEETNEPSFDDPGTDIEFTEEPTEEPLEDTSEEPSEETSEEPAADVSEEPAADASEAPAADVSEEPAADASEEPSEEPTADASEAPSDEPSSDASEAPSEEPGEATEEPEEKPALTAKLSVDTVAAGEYITVSGTTVKEEDTVIIEAFGLDYKTTAKGGAYSYELQVLGKEEMEGKYKVTVSDGENTVALDLTVTPPLMRDAKSGGPSATVALLKAIKYTPDTTAMAFITKVILTGTGESAHRVSLQVGSNATCSIADVSNLTVKLAIHITDIPAEARNRNLTATVNVSVADNPLSLENSTLTASWNDAVSIDQYASVSDQALVDSGNILMSVWKDAWSSAN